MEDERVSYWERDWDGMGFCGLGSFFGEKSFWKKFFSKFYSENL